MSDGITASATVTSSNNTNNNQTNNQENEGGLIITNNGISCIDDNTYTAYDSQGWENAITVQFNGTTVLSGSYNVSTDGDRDQFDTTGSVKLTVSYNGYSKNITINKC